MLEHLLATLLEITISVSLVIAVLLLLRPLIGRRYAAKWRYWIWLAVAIRLLIPFNFSLPQAPLQIERPAATKSAQPAFASEALPAANAATGKEAASGLQSEPKTAADLLPPAKPPLTAAQIAGFLWLAGMLAFPAFHIAGHILFMRKVRRWARDAAEPVQLEMFEETLSRLGIRGCVRLKISPALSGPMLTGLLRPTVWLPAETYDRQQLEVIFRHELIHHKQRHLVYKAVLLAAQSVHWFNPFVHLLAREAGRDVEHVCDSEAVKGRDMEYRKRYSRVILSLMSARTSRNSALATPFNGGKKAMLRRFASILDTRGKSGGLPAGLLLSSLLIASGVLVACEAKTPPAAEPTPAADSAVSGTAAEPEDAQEGEPAGDPPSSDANEPAASDASPETNEPAPSNRTLGDLPYRTTVRDDASRDFLGSESGQQLEQTARAFTEAYLAGDREQMNAYLTDPDHRRNDYPSATEHSAVQSVNLKLGVEDRTSGTQTASMELAYSDKDMLYYLTLEMQNTESGWMVAYYGLEG
ncbi:M56 family metallopeptidase [Saccharibacillus alkalitolerans]|uniref:Peptidase M56 domain-containing protein n=1 Tax=Saccharibacillus alkalitolerans TaxID=2705290 RepID=A0ABX0F8F5_9BACL|nr:M56 family metallopeptidase [Saccharibacillus alkalitolerans]NGZ76294.1 hypothetical protein [Saccharibacillus alkalitolerans]